MTIAGEVEKFYPDTFTLGETTWGEELLIVPAEGTRVPRAITLRAARGEPYVHASRIEVTGE